MDLPLFFKTVLSHSHHQREELGLAKTRHQPRGQGERGDVVLPLVLSLMLSCGLFGSLFWLNKHYEKKTKEHLSEFQKNWRKLSEKYQNKNVVDKTGSGPDSL